MGIIWNWIVDNYFVEDDDKTTHEMADFLSSVAVNLEDDANSKKEQIYAELRGWDE